ncbi:Spy/CpxP family protein refolding chaperone [Flavobacterium fluviatile]|uniref:Spy/CpxP family protein refolding chaperone n=1 Tax=Flavobacterium fluviatile TaxID=1862387 RepID=UPI0013D2EA40|nr:hypothetical protein [Flavobacterium fluviatile]
MNKIKVLSYAVIILVILNLSIIFFFMIMKPRESRGLRNGPRVMIMERLHFDEQQRKEFHVIIEEHKDKINVVEDEIQHTKENLYLQLSQSEVDLKVKDSLISVLGDLQQQIELARFEHFKQIRKICNTPEQRGDFKDLMIELAEKIPQQNLHPKKN